jgi:uncharacterized protein YndB with AHSA1/START domain
MTPPVAKTQMLIRRPVADVFEAFVDPAITSRFWFTKGSGRLEPGANVRWDWEMYGVFAQVQVKVIEPRKRIVIEWSMYGPPTTVEWVFTPRGDRATFVTIANWGFTGSDDEVVKQSIDSMGGFSFLLAGAKALLEHGIVLTLVLDHAPDAQKR